MQGTAFDFRDFKAIGKDIAQVDNGYDTNFVLRKTGDGSAMQPCAVYVATVTSPRMLTLHFRVKEPSSGRIMTVSTTGENHAIPNMIASHHVLQSLACSSTLQASSAARLGAKTRCAALMTTPLF